ncbi:MAG TPA: YkvA family protein [Woeseiaceae bacterium]|nr:YkvA family protein [Woeseiaceae bacterium]
MTRKVVLELSEQDIDYFRNVMEETWKRNAQRSEKEIFEEARRLIERTRKPEPPEYVRKRLADLETLISMLEDDEWPLEQEQRGRIVAAITYFADPQDLIPDTVPGLGFLDDALLASLVIDELEHNLAGFREFCEYRKNQEEVRGEEGHVSREDWLAAKRRQIFLQIARRQRESRRHGSTEGPTDPILRYMSYP